MDLEADVDALVGMLRELGWTAHTDREAFPIQLREHYDQGVRDGLISKPLPKLYSREYLLGWIDGRLGRAAIKVMKQGGIA